MMRSLWILLMLSGCAWTHKEFQNSVDAPAINSAPSVNVDKNLLDKFQVESIPAPVAVDNESNQKKISKASKQNLTQKKLVPKPIKEKSNIKVEKKVTASPKSLPADYPAELVAINDAAKKTWELYRPSHHVDQKMFLDIHYLGMTVGKIVLINRGKKMINGKEVWHFHSRFKSAPFYSSIYELDDTVDTYVIADSFLSLRYSLIQRESKQDLDDLQLHDRDQLKTFWFYKQKRPGKPDKEKNGDRHIPYYSVDPFSVVYFYQGLPLKDGDNYEIPVVNKGKLMQLKSLVEGRETIDTEKGRRKAIRVHAVTQYTGEHIKSGDMTFWFSDDEQKVLLKAKAKIKIGSVTADIVE